MSITHRVKRTLGVATAGAMVLSLMPAGAAFAEFDDVCEGAPENDFDDADSISETQEPFVDCMAAYGITVGDNDGDFNPGEFTSRQHMALFLARTLSQAEDGDLTIPEDEDDEFSDISDVNPQEARHAINWLEERGLIEGYEDGTYRPAVDVNRGQMASFIVRLMVELGVDIPATTDDHFEDDDGTFHEDNINILAELGIVQGFGDGTYRPGAEVTRQQMAAYVIGAVIEIDEAGNWNGQFIEDEGPIGNATFTAAPELVRVDEASFDDNDEELVLTYTFDEDLQAVDNEGLFFVYEADGSAITADSAVLATDESQVTVTFSVDEDTYDLLTVATVAHGAVVDADEEVNPEGRFGLGDVTIDQAAPGLDTQPNLISVARTSSQTGTTINETRFTFSYDDDVTVTGGDTGFTLVFQDGSTEVPCAAEGVETDDDIEVICDARVLADDWARGLDEITGANTVLQAYAAANSATPDLTDVNFLSSDRAQFVFDEQVRLPGEVDDSNDPAFAAAGGDLTDWQVYDETGAAVNPTRVVVSSDRRIVTAQFPTTPFGGTTTIAGDAVGGWVDDGAVIERFGDNNPNVRDEARAGAASDVTVESGETLTPNLVSVSEAEESATDLFGDPIEWEVVFTFDDDVTACDAGQFRLYEADGTPHEGDTCDPDDEEVTVTFSDEDVLDAVLGGVGNGAATSTAGDNAEDSAGV